MARGCFKKIITFLAAGLLIMMLAVNVSEAAIAAVCANDGDCDSTNNEVCTTLACACDTEFTNTGMAGTCDLNCPALSNPAAGTVSISGVTGTYTCDAEYTVTGGPTQTCASGAWGGSPATCVLSCTTPPNPADGTVSVSGVTVTYSCNTEYSISGSATRTCSSSAWTGSAPTCTFDCTVVLANPADGTVIVSGVTGTYTCNTGFSMTGGPTQTCASGNWGGTVATCALACTGQLDPPDGAVSISANMATFTCEDGYTLSDSTPLTCTTEWSGSAPTCSQNSGVGGPGVSNSLVGIIITCLLTALAM